MFKFKQPRQIDISFQCAPFERSFEVVIDEDVGAEMWCGTIGLFREIGRSFQIYFRNVWGFAAFSNSFATAIGANNPPFLEVTVRDRWRVWWGARLTPRRLSWYWVSVEAKDWKTEAPTWSRWHRPFSDRKRVISQRFRVELTLLNRGICWQSNIDRVTDRGVGWLEPLRAGEWVPTFIE